MILSKKIKQKYFYKLSGNQKVSLLNFNIPEIIIKKKITNQGGCYTRLASSKSRVTNERNSSATPIRSALSLSVCMSPLLPLLLFLSVAAATAHHECPADRNEIERLGSEQGPTSAGCTHTYATTAGTSTRVHARASTGMKTATPVSAFRFPV